MVTRLRFPSVVAILVSLGCAGCAQDKPPANPALAGSPAGPDKELPPKLKPGQVVHDPFISTPLNLVWSSSKVFVGKVKKIDWADTKQASFYPSWVDHWGTAQIECLDPIRGVKVGELVTVTVFRRHASPVDREIPGYELYRRADIQAGSTWLIFDEGTTQGAMERLPQAPKSLIWAAASVPTGKDPIVEQVRQAVNLHNSGQANEEAQLTKILGDDFAKSGYFLYSYASQSCPTTKMEPAKVAGTLNVAIEKNIGDEVVCGELLDRLSEFHWTIAPAVQQMLLQDAPLFLASSQALREHFAGALLVTFLKDSDLPLDIPTRLPKEVAIMDPVRVIASLQTMTEEFKIEEARARQLPEIEGTNSRKFRIEALQALQRYLTWLAASVQNSTLNPDAPKTQKGTNGTE